MQTPWDPTRVKQAIEDDIWQTTPGGFELATEVSPILIQGLDYCEARVTVRVGNRLRKFCGLGASLDRAVEALRSEVETGLRS